MWWSRLLFNALLLTALCPLPSAAQWIDQGAVVCSFTGDQFGRKAVSDGAGGIIIVWGDDRSGNSDIYAQRLNAAGIPQWRRDGVPVCTAGTNQSFPMIASDGKGGAVIAWRDVRFGPHLFAQRVDVDGMPQWTVDGIQLDGPSSFSMGSIVSDGANGAIVAWRYQDATEGIWAQRVNSTGTVLWTAGGVQVSDTTATAAIQGPVLVANGSGGAIVAWLDSRAGNADVYARRVDNLGIPLGPANGAALCTLPSTQQAPLGIAEDNSAGAIVTWRDNRSGNAGIYGARLTTTGTVPWAVDGVVVCDTTLTQQDQSMVSDGTGGAIIVWEDSRYSGSSVDLFAQRISANGVQQWDPDGVPVSIVTGGSGLSPRGP